MQNYVTKVKVEPFITECHFLSQFSKKNSCRLVSYSERWVKSLHFHLHRSVLEKGGSAVDAAVAMLLCQGVCDPLRSGLGGGLSMVVYQRSSRTALAVDAREAVPAKASRDMFQDDTTRPGRGRPLIRTSQWRRRLIMELQKDLKYCFNFRNIGRVF